MTGGWSHCAREGASPIVMRARATWGYSFGRLSRMAFEIQSLERRTLLSAANQISFGNFSSTENLVGNGYGPNFDRRAMNRDGVLHLTDAADHEARSVWYKQAVPIERFTTNFSYR